MLTISPGEDINLPMVATSLYSSRKGSLIVSYCNKEKTALYVGAVMETAEEANTKVGWKVRGGDQMKLKMEINERLGGTEGLGPAISKLTERVEDWYLFPVYKLPPKGEWSRGKVLLLGDAAHAVSVAINARFINMHAYHSRCHPKARAWALPSKTACSYRAFSPRSRTRPSRTSSPATNAIVPPRSTKRLMKRAGGGRA